MSKYLKLFDTTSQYNAYTADTANFIKPNVSLIDETSNVEFTPYVETMVVAKYNVTESKMTQMILGYSSNGQTSALTTAFTSVYVDGNEIEISGINYTFDTVGEHIVKYELRNPTAINSSAFNGSHMGPYNGVNAVSITIPNSVTTIGSQAFYACSGLTSIVIPDSVTSINGDAFGNTPWWGTYSAETSHKYDNIVYINDIAYKATRTNITNCTFREGTSSIGGDAFNGCTGLTSIGTIGSGASVEIPNSVTSIGDGAFKYCSRLTSIEIPNSVTSINGLVFSSCTGLTSIDIPDNITSIGIGAFGSCSGLTSCTIGSGVTSIEQLAFNNCKGLTSMTIEATTPPTLANANSFNNTNNCPIYVPSASVDTYKAATNWSNLASRIQPIA